MAGAEEAKPEAAKAPAEEGKPEHHAEHAEPVGEADLEEEEDEGVEHDSGFDASERLLEAAMRGDREDVHRRLDPAVTKPIADVNTRDGRDWTPLHWAARNGHEQVSSATSLALL